MPYTQFCQPGDFSISLLYSVSAAQFSAPAGATVVPTAINGGVMDTSAAASSTVIFDTGNEENVGCKNVSLAADYVAGNASNYTFAIFTPNLAVNFNLLQYGATSGNVALWGTDNVGNTVLLGVGTWSLQLIP